LGRHETNDVAEYTGLVMGLVMGLHEALKLGVTSVT
jgi:hypothetical protein